MRGGPSEYADPGRARTALVGHYFETVATQLRLLSEAGFAPVDCFWKHFNNTLIGGFKNS